MKKYNSPEVEIVDDLDVISTSSEVETEYIPFSNENKADFYEL